MAVIIKDILLMLKINKEIKLLVVPIHAWLCRFPEDLISKDSKAELILQVLGLQLHNTIRLDLPLIPAFA